MSQPPLNNPGARYWDDLMEEFDFSPDEKREIRQGADHVIAEVRARRLAEVRKRQNATQVEVAAAMGVSQARISRIEKGQLEKSEVETLAAYVKALGGKLKIIADFGDDQHPGLLLLALVHAPAKGHAFCRPPRLKLVSSL